MHKIMIVDDDNISLAIGRAFLEDKYELLLMQTGQQSISTLRHETLPDLIMLDMLMPGMDGLEVLQIIKQDSMLKEIPVIILTGERSEEMVIKGYSCGAADFLLKPVDRDILDIKIQQQLLYADLRRENLKLRNKLKFYQDRQGIPEQK